MYVLKNKFYLIAVALIDAAGYLLAFPFRLLKKPRLPADVKKILVIRLDHIGDVVLSTCVPENLKSRYPVARIDFLAPSWAGDILKNNPYVDRLICYDAPWFSRRQKNNFKPKGFLRLAGELRREGYDLGFDLRGDLRQIVLMSLAGIKFKVGYGVTGGGFLLDLKVAYRKERAAAQRNLDLLQAAGIRPSTSRSRLYTVTADQEAAEQILRECGAGPDDFTALIHPFAGYSSKNWQEARFAEVIRGLHEKYGAKVGLVGSGQDKEANDRIIGASSVPAFNLSGKTPLGVLASLLKKVNLFVGVDSGPGQIAAAVGVPAVVICSATNKAGEWIAQASSIAAIQKEVPCADCQKTECGQRLCMDLILAQEVMAAVSEVLKKQ